MHHFLLKKRVIFLCYVSFLDCSWGPSKGFVESWVLQCTVETPWYVFIKLEITCHIRTGTMQAYVCVCIYIYTYAYYSIHICIASNLYHTTKSSHRCSVCVAGLFIFFCAKEILYRRYTALGGFSPYESFLGHEVCCLVEFHQGSGPSVLWIGEPFLSDRSVELLTFRGYFIIIRVSAPKIHRKKNKQTDFGAFLKSFGVLKVGPQALKVSPFDWVLWVKWGWPALGVWMKTMWRAKTSNSSALWMMLLGTTALGVCGVVWWWVVEWSCCLVMPTDDLFMSSVMSHKCFKNQWDFLWKKLAICYCLQFFWVQSLTPRVYIGTRYPSFFFFLRFPFGVKGFCSPFAGRQKVVCLQL